MKVEELIEHLKGFPGDWDIEMVNLDDWCKADLLGSDGEVIGGFVVLTYGG